MSKDVSDFCQNEKGKVRPPEKERSNVTRCSYYNLLVRWRHLSLQNPTSKDVRLWGVLKTVYL